MNEQQIFATEIHKPIRRKFQRRKVIVTKIDEVWGMDLASMETLSEYNNGFKFILCIIDVFSKYAWAIPLKNKTSSSVLNALTTVISQSERIPEKIWVDKGSEFYNKQFQSWAKTNNITIYSTYSESKSVVAERFIRTLKHMLAKYFTANNSRNWIEVLPNMLELYNNRKHKTIGMTPEQASEPQNELEVLLKFLPQKMTKKRPRFTVGEQVRISRIRPIFENIFQGNYSYEVFTVHQILDTSPVTYKLSDYSGEVLDGSFYEAELEKTQVPTYYEVEKILSTRTVGRKKQYLVKFYGWPDKFNEWLTEDQIHAINE